MMLAYQPVKSLTKVNIMFSQGLSAAKRLMPIIDEENIDRNSNNFAIVSTLISITDLEGIL